MTSINTDLILFDCDGVLVDSEPISTTVFVEYLVEMGLEINENTVYRKFLGRSMGALATVLSNEFDFTITDEHLQAIRGRLFNRLSSNLKPITGISQVIGSLEQAICVASSSQVDRIRLSLGVTDLLRFFEPHIFSASMVENGKPAPDLFLHAARTMGVSPARCLVIEDSPAGIEAAKRAGMQVFAFVGGTHAAPANLRERAKPLAPDAVFDDMSQLPSLLQN